MTLRSNRAIVRTVTILLLTWCGASQVYAFTGSRELKGVFIRLYGPDWIWQRRDVNLLAVGENRTDEARLLELKLIRSDGSREAFLYDGPEILSLDLPPGETVRAAFTRLTAADGVPLGIYPLVVTCEIDGEETTFEHPVRIIRGGAVRPGVWAVVTPAFLAGLWCVLMVIYLNRIGGRGAWRKPGESPMNPAKKQVSDVA
jgi:hypothetical protein